MRIFIIPGTPDGDNLGDVAMFQMAVERLRALWPDAAFSVLMRRPAVFKAICPGARLVSLRASRFWLKRNPGSWKSWLPHRAFHERQFARVFPGSDLVVVAGCGILADAFQRGDARLLNLLEAAIELGMPTAMLGQGIGPLEDRMLFDHAARVLPRVDALFVREAGATLDWLRRLRVPEDRIRITGDDAIELAHRQRPSFPGDGLGVNLRVAGYAGVEGGLIETVRSVLVGAAARLPARLLGLPIARGRRDSDVLTLKRLLPEDRGLERMPWDSRALIERVSRCRVVVTGSYHAGVFALALGIPVVAIVESAYYAAKFQGLAGQFGGGCRLVTAGEDGFSNRLGEAVEAAWAESAAVRPGLLLAAEKQITAGQEAYARLAALDPVRRARDVKTACSSPFRP